jgi:hypothetical protein
VRCRPGNRGCASRAGHSRASPAVTRRAPRRTEAPAPAGSREAGSPAACRVVACRAVACRAARVVPMAGTKTMAGRTARCHTADRRTPGRTRALRMREALRMLALLTRAGPMPVVRAAACHTVLPRMVLPRTVLPRTVLPRAALRPVGGLTPGGLAAGPMAGWGRAGTGCRTGAGWRRGRIACTGRRDRARRAAPRVGTMGRGRRSRITTRTAGAGRARRHQGATRPVGPVRAGPVPGYRPGRAGQPGLRRRVSTCPPGRASRHPTAVTGLARRRSRQVR